MKISFKSAKNDKNSCDHIPLTNSEGKVRELTEEDFASAVAFSDLSQNLQNKLEENQNSLKSSSQNLYETDYLLWLEITLEQVKQRQIDKLDWDNLAEEIEGLKISLHHQVDSYLRPLLIHLLLYQYSTTEREKSGSDWRGKIYDLRDELANLLEYSKTLYNYFINRIDVIYPRARKSVIIKTELSPTTFPEQCPFSVEQLLDLDFYPEL